MTDPTSTYRMIIAAVSAGDLDSLDQLIAAPITANSRACLELASESSSPRSTSSGSPEASRPNGGGPPTSSARWSRRARVSSHPAARTAAHDGKVVFVSEVGRDRWSEWLLRHRHGNDPERRRAMLEQLTRIRDAVLDRAWLAAGDTLLDVGCGDGLIGFGALDRVGPTGRVIFADVSQDLLELCRRRAAELDATRRCEFVRGSADRLDAVAGASVDAVTTRSVLIYVADKPACFSQFHRVLRPGGRLSVHEPINAFAARTGGDGRFWGYDIAPVADLAAKVEALYASLQPPDTDPMLDFDERDLLHAAEQAGFTEIHLELRVDIEPRLPPLGWEAFAHSAGNPLIPTIAEALAQTLSPAETERFQAHLRPLVETGRGEHRLATANLWATKRTTATEQRE